MGVTLDTNSKFCIVTIFSFFFPYNQLHILHALLLMFLVSIRTKFHTIRSSSSQIITTKQ